MEHFNQAVHEFLRMSRKGFGVSKNSDQDILVRAYLSWAFIFVGYYIVWLISHCYNSISTSSADFSARAVRILSRVNTVFLLISFIAGLIIIWKIVDQSSIQEAKGYVIFFGVMHWLFLYSMSSFRGQTRSEQRNQNLQEVLVVSEQSEQSQQIGQREQPELPGRIPEAERIRLREEILNRDNAIKQEQMLKRQQEFHEQNPGAPLLPLSHMDIIVNLEKKLRKEKPKESVLKEMYYARLKYKIPVNLALLHYAKPLKEDALMMEELMAIKALFSAVYSSGKIEQKKCSACEAAFDANDQVVEVCCRNAAHFMCVIRASNRKPFCPFCNFPYRILLVQLIDQVISPELYENEAEESNS